MNPVEVALIFWSDSKDRQKKIQELLHDGKTDKGL